MSASGRIRQLLNRFSGGSTGGSSASSACHPPLPTLCEALARQEAQVRVRAPPLSRGALVRAWAGVGRRPLQQEQPGAG